MTKNKTHPTPEETTTPSLESPEPNPLLSTSLGSPAPTSPAPLASELPASASPSDEQRTRATPEEAEDALRWLLDLLADWLDPDKPATDREVKAIASAAAEGLPLWVFAWPLRLAGSSIYFVKRRWPPVSWRRKPPIAPPAPGSTPPPAPEQPADDDE
jgi:hypothetical protein